MDSSGCEHLAVVVLVLMAVVTDVGVGVGVDEDAGDGASEEAASLACKLVYHQRECVDQTQKTIITRTLFLYMIVWVLDQAAIDAQLTDTNIVPRPAIL
jgi:hypothetical protein